MTLKRASAHRDGDGSRKERKGGKERMEGVAENNRRKGSRKGRGKGRNYTYTRARNPTPAPNSNELISRPGKHVPSSTDAAYPVSYLPTYPSSGKPIIDPSPFPPPCQAA
jgi:hypothetical protein